MLIVLHLVFQTHSQKPELAVRLARQMTHSIATATRVYNCANAERNSSEVTAEVGEKDFYFHCHLQLISDAPSTSFP